MKIIVKRSFFKNGRIYKRGEEIDFPNAELLIKDGLVDIVEDEIKEEAVEEQIETEAVEKPEKKVKKKTSTKKKKVEE